MSDLNFIEKSKLEKLFNMGGGYVLEFSNRTFGEFVTESIQKNIWDQKYDYGSGSKANRLRALWKEEPNYIVGKLIADMLEHLAERHKGIIENELFGDCRRIADRFRQGAPIQEIEAITQASGDHNFDLLAKSVRQSIEKNEPEMGLDRLHTFITKYIRRLCEKHGIAIEKDRPLHSLIGEYIKRLKKKNLIESEMTERILKSSIAILEAFNHVRNQQSLAHDNPILNYDESLLIFNHVSSAVRFIDALEDRVHKQIAPPQELEDDDLPF
ncbi:MAG: hypothetical protein A2W25_09215 [candidate division Zixibacteria bacterium RBG_16_53_22]|nr:MAG: hypothetical protein A2W25_09215 [candidate division Zixibacteria bacterium RBG_16_53_22]